MPRCAQATVEELRRRVDADRAQAEAAEAGARQLQADAVRTAMSHAAQTKRHQQVVECAQRYV
jgi:hypothetical protein